MIDLFLNQNSTRSLLCIFRFADKQQNKNDDLSYFFLYKQKINIMIPFGLRIFQYIFRFIIIIIGWHHLKPERLYNMLKKHKKA
ncbi:unnamed protein product, partial [marine sediment metagenome]